MMLHRRSHTMCPYQALPLKHSLMTLNVTRPSSHIHLGGYEVSLSLLSHSLFFLFFFCLFLPCSSLRVPPCSFNLDLPCARYGFEFISVVSVSCLRLSLWLCFSLVNICLVWSRGAGRWMPQLAREVYPWCHAQTLRMKSFRARVLTHVDMLPSQYTLLQWFWSTDLFLTSSSTHSLPVCFSVWCPHDGKQWLCFLLWCQ